MILCPICLTKFNKEKHEVSGGIKCPSCKQEIDNMTVIQCIPFADCITLIRVVEINKDPNSILEMFRDAIGKS